MSGYGGGGPQMQMGNSGGNQLGGLQSPQSGIGGQPTMGGFAGASRPLPPGAGMGQPGQGSPGIGGGGFNPAMLQAIMGHLQNGGIGGSPQTMGGLGALFGMGSPGIGGQPMQGGGMPGQGGQWMLPPGIHPPAQYSQMPQQRTMPVASNPATSYAGMAPPMSSARAMPSRYGGQITNPLVNM